MTDVYAVEPKLKEENEQEQILLNICAAIIEYAIYEWKQLDYGRYLRRRINAQMVYALELEAFFQGKYFERLLGYVLPDMPPEVVRKRIRCTKGDIDARQASLSPQQKNIEARHTALYPNFVRKGKRYGGREQTAADDDRKTAGGK